MGSSTDLLEERCSETNRDTNLQRWAWLPVAMVATLVVLLAPLDIRASYEPAWLIPTLNGMVFIGASVICAVLAAQAYLTSGSNVARTLGAGLLTFGAACVVGALLVGLGRAQAAVSAHNLLALLSGAIILAGAINASVGQSNAQPSKGYLIKLGGTYSACLLAAAGITTLALAGKLPPFITSHGTTSLRSAVLSATVAEYLTAALLLSLLGRYVRIVFLRWYCLGLTLIALGLAGVALSVLGTPLCWVGRCAQALGQVYILTGLITLPRRRAAGTAGMALTQVFERLEQDLRNSEQTLKTITDNIPDIVTRFDREFRHLYMSPSVSSISGLPPEVFIGKTNVELGMPEDLVRMWHDNLQKVFDSGCERQVEFVFNTIDGPRNYHALLAPQFASDGSVETVIGVSRDVTDQKRAEQALSESRDKLYNTLESITDGFLALDGNWVYTYFNKTGAEIIGMNVGDLVGKCVWELFPHAEGTRFYTGYHEAVRTGKPLTFEEYYPEPLNKWLECHCYPSQDGLSVYFRDVTERHELEAHKAEFYRRTILGATDGKLIISEKSEIDAIAHDSVATWDVRDNQSLRQMSDDIRHLSEGAGLSSTHAINFQACVVEAATNATKHAGGGAAYLCVHENTLVYVISDSGLGIGAMSLPDVALTKGYSTAGTLGMGYKVMLTFADKVYLSTGPEGTTVAIEMSLHPTSALPDILIKNLSGWDD